MEGKGFQCGLRPSFIGYVVYNLDSLVFGFTYPFLLVCCFCSL